MVWRTWAYLTIETIWYNKAMAEENEKLELPIEKTAKGLRYFTIDLDLYSIEETGTVQKDGKPAQYIKFKFNKK